MRTVHFHLPSDETVALTAGDADRVIEFLWAVSMVPGAVAAVGKIQHALTNGAAAEIGDAEEATALQAALADESRLTPALEQLRSAAGRSV